jgi:hypothetical protein
VWNKNTEYLTLFVPAETLTMSDDTDKSSIRIAPFSGKHFDWPVWREKFMARARRKGYKEILTGGATAPADSVTIDVTTPEGKAQKALRDANETAYEALVLLIDGETAVGRVAFNIVRGCKTSELADGDAWLAWKRLCDKYEPKSAPSRLALKSEFNNKVLKNANQDPDVWLTELEDLRMQLMNAGSKMSEDELLEHVLNNLPKEYEVVVSKLEDRLGNSVNGLTIEDVRNELNLKFQRLNKGRNHASLNSNGNDGETALFAGGFKGKCNGCGEWGHKRAQCPNRNNNNNGGGGNGDSNNSGGKFTGKCHYCKKPGHRIGDCRKKKAKEAKNNETANVAVENDVVETELAFMAATEDVKQDTNDINIGDTGASRHMTNVFKGFTNWKPIKEPVTTGSGKVVYATREGDRTVKVVPVEGDPFIVTQRGCWYVPDMGYNLFSITKAIDSGFQIGNEGTVMHLEKGKHRLKFDRHIRTKNGWIGGVKLVPMEDVRMVTPKLQKGAKVDAGTIHGVFGHVGDETTKATANYYGMTILGDLHPCSDCLKAKARQKNLGASNADSKSTIPGERLGFDISSIKDESIGGSKFWLLIVDEATDYSWSFFLKAKSETPKRMAELIGDLKTKYNKLVKFLRCDGAGENKKTDELLKTKNFGITFEYTAPGTPQQNGKVERKFATLYGRIRATLNALKAPEELRTSLWAEAANKATFDDGFLVKRRGDKPAYDKFFGKSSNLVPFMRCFGEMAVLTSKSVIAGKSHNKGVEAMFVGYAKDHAPGVYRFYCFETKSIRESRDWRFLNQLYPQWIRKGGSNVIHWDDDDADKVVQTTTNVSQHIETPTTQETTTAPPIESEQNIGRATLEPHGTVASSSRNERNNEPRKDSSRLIRELSRLGTSYNEEATKALEEAKAQEEKIEEQVSAGNDVGNLALTLFGREAAFVAKTALEEVPELKEEKNDNSTVDKLMDDLDATLKDEEMDVDSKNERLRLIVGLLKEFEPTTFNEAYNNKNVKFRDRFREAIRKEFRDMIARGVWRNMKRRDVPQGRRLVKSKWVFEIKRSGRFRARLVACGYSQIPGVDFQNSYAPTINDVSWRILIVAMLLWNLSAKIVDVETAFLMGELDEDIYMEAPEGSGLGRDECVKLEKSTYGLVQAARQYYKTFARALRKIGFTGGVADPCLMVKRNELGVCFIAIWVDDSLLVGDEKAITQTIKDLEAEGFTLKVENDLTDYLSCEIKLDRKKKRGWIHQPHLIKKLRDKFGTMVKDMPIYATPGSPHHVIVRKVEQKISEDEQSTYRSGVGMLLYLTKHSRPDIANAVRELTKVLDGASPAAYKEMKRVIKYVLDTEKLALKIEPVVINGKGFWKIVIYSDSDYATDPENRLSVSGFVLYLCGVPICWRTKQQRSVTLSSSEAEFVALSEAVKEIRFVYQLLQEIGIKVELPITVRVDNIGAIFMAENVQVSQRTKHIDTRMRFVNQYVDDGFIKISFVGTADNDADLFTKNLSRDLHTRHGEKIVENKD